MKRILIITYYWPPSGGSGVQRWLKMSKYLPENGWQPVIYTTEDAEYPIIDPSLEKVKYNWKHCNGKLSSEPDLCPVFF